MATQSRRVLVLHKVVILGSGGVGKTALCTRYLLQHFPETYDPTLEDSYRKQTVVDGQPSMVELLDTAGQEEYAALREQWIQGGEGFLLVYSTSSRSAFEAIKKYYQQIQDIKKNPATPVLLVGNKCDLAAGLREVPAEDGKALARELGCEFLETSAKDDVNVEAAFVSVVRGLQRIKREETEQDRMRAGHPEVQGYAKKEGLSARLTRFMAKLKP